MPFPPPPAAALTSTGKPNDGCLFDQGLIAAPAVCPGHPDNQAQPARRTACTRPGRGPCHPWPNRLRRWSDKYQPGIPHCPAKCSFSDRKPIARMDGLGLTLTGCLQDTLDIQVRLPAGAGPIKTASSARRACTERRSASENTATLKMPISRQARITRRNFTPVCYQYLSKHHSACLLHTENAKTLGTAGRGEFNATESASASTWRVSAGSITPSSHRRAVE
jgi:hypothetical protein